MLILTLISSIRHTLMQIVYISNRPDTFAETLAHVALLMPFIDKALVCVPKRIKEQFQQSPPKLPLTIVTEESLLDKQQLATLGQLDHQRRNYLLRTRLVHTDQVEAQFIMSDDDARPLKSIDLARFIQGGQYRQYYFYDLAHWNNNQTEFDNGQISTYAVLEHENLPHLSYASHMPQLIDRALFNEATAFFKTHAHHHALCEWSTYFNYASAKHPEKFCLAEAYTTLCWPEHPLAWKPFIEPKGYLFENFTPALYKKGQVFSHLISGTGAADKAGHLNASVEKASRWRKFVISERHPEQAKSIAKYANPRTWINKLIRHV